MLQNAFVEFFVLNTLDVVNGDFFYFLISDVSDA